MRDASASFRYSIQQLRFNADAGHDVFVRLAGGTVSIVSHYDGSLTLATNGFLQTPAWTGAPLVLTTPGYTLLPGKDIEVQFFASVDTSLLYSLRSADTLLGSLGFANTFMFSTAPGAPAFTGNTVNITALGIQGGVFTAPVPEPSTYALMLAAPGALGFAARRAKQRVA